MGFADTIAGVRRALPILAALLLAGCGGDEETTSTAATPSSTLSSTTDTSSSATAPYTTGPAADAGDEEAQALARAGQSAIELYATDNGGSYAGLDAAALREIEPSLPEDVNVYGGKNFYSLTWSRRTPATSSRSSPRAGMSPKHAASPGSPSAGKTAPGELRA